MSQTTLQLMTGCSCTEVLKLVVLFSSQDAGITAFANSGLSNGGTECET